MILLNFSHPITDDQERQIERALGNDVAGETLNIVKIDSQFDIGLDFADQITALTDACQLSPNEWQTERILINLPALSTAAALLLAELHGRCGYYLPALRFKQVDGSIPPRYELAEILDINSQRQNARKRR